MLLGRALRVIIGQTPDSNCHYLRGRLTALFNASSRPNMPFENTESSTDAVREFKERLSNLETEEGRFKGLNFKPGKDDVFIVTPAKCGTTWMQQIVHGLRSGGDMSFEEICLVIPCVEMAHDYGYIDLNKDQGFLPRVFKTHLYYPHCPKGAGKYIYVIRDPCDAALSFYHFMANWYFQASDISFEECVREFNLRRGAPANLMINASYWHNLASWYPHRLDDNVLWLHFEDMKEDLAACVKLVAKFLDIGAEDEALQKLVVKQASFEFMKEHPTKFDAHPIKLARNVACGLHKYAGLEGNNPGKVRAGSSGKARDILPPELLAAMDERFADVVGKPIGCAMYGELREKVNKELKRPFGK